MRLEKGTMTEKEFQDEADRLTVLNLYTFIESQLPAGSKATEFLAVMSLLDDPDEQVCQAVRRKIISYGRKAVGFLHWHERNDPNPYARQSAKVIIRHFRKEAVDELLEMVKMAKEATHDIDLEASFVLLSRLGYPETDSDEVAKALDDIALRAHALFMKAQQHNELGLLLSLNQAFFEEAEFAGAEDTAYHSPDNTYAQALVKHKRGIPISLCTLYLLVAERVGINLYGVGMPAHFVVYSPELDIFIDAFNKGAFLSREDCKNFIKSAGFTFEPSMLERVSNIAILLRMIRNLIFAYSKSDHEWEVDALHELSAAILETMNQEEQ